MSTVWCCAPQSPIDPVTTEATKNVVDAEDVLDFWFADAAASYARQHRDIVENFGRFPHRNAVLGRDSSPAEEACLADDAPRFGQ